ncbi:hypothetical protein [Metabacillus sp. RGM 3146]|uniref:hypothetical protein n=1 Tax=Metabacillus sp. RGM 3146 TaxID=3401092 RepID=UPI003B994249
MTIRRYAAFINPITTNIFHLRNPWIIAWWSAAFPGFGYYLLGKYLTGFILMLWEVLINNYSHLNEAIFYSMIGKFDTAKLVISEDGLWLYITVYVFNIWDSYRRAVEYNKYYVLSCREGYHIAMRNMSSLEVNVLEKRKPFWALFWSSLTPGLGHIYLNRLPSIIFGLILWIYVAYHSHLYQCIFYTASGRFSDVHQIANPQHFLYIPSLFVFIIYDSYINTVVYNKLMDKEQGKYLKKEYQHPRFKMPF